MNYRFYLLVFFIFLWNCKSSETSKKSTSDVKVVSAMKNVMWKGELESTIHLDTISDKNNLYGIGPLSFLQGELLIIDGQSYVSKVLSDSTMVVTETYNVGAPFFVYANQKDWKINKVPSNIKSIKEFEEYITNLSKDYNYPFVFKLMGTVNSAKIHIQNLPKGAKVSNPTEAHQGQTNYSLNNKSVEIVGFFSKEHQGVFTHHDSFIHMHLITSDKSMMGHLDEVDINNLQLYLPD